MRARHALLLCNMMIGLASVTAQPAQDARSAKPGLTRRQIGLIGQLGDDWFAARPKTLFEEWDPAKRAALEERAEQIGALADADFQVVVDLLWKSALKQAPKWKKAEFETPDGVAKWIERGKGGRKQGFALGLHGGGEGAGDMSEAAGSWNPEGCLCMFPQGIKLVHDTWNTVHGERLALTLIEYAKWRFDVDPDRVFAMGFSMGGSGTFHLAGRHPDLLAGAIPAHGVIMAEPKSQLARKEEVVTLQHGLLPNLRNLAMYWYTGSVDQNCRPGTYLFAWDRLLELQSADPDGYRKLTFQCHEGLAHAYPSGEPQAGFDVILKERRVAFPDHLVWEYASDPYPLPEPGDRATRFVKRWYYYVHCREPADRMHVRVRKEGNEFKVDVKGVDPAQLELMLNPAMIDPAQPVVVQVDGKRIADAVVAPDFRTILESLDARMDRTLVFDRRIRLAAGNEPAER